MSRLRAHPLLLVSAFCLAQSAASPYQSGSSEHSFTASPAEVQAAVNRLQPTFSGRLPALDGFVVAGKKSLDQYRRPYYQCTVRVTSSSSGGSLVRVIAKITAWHEDPPRSGYEVLQSNGRLESDLLERLQESLASPSSARTEAEPPPEISAPVPQLPQHTTAANAPVPADSRLRNEVHSLEEVLRNQSHPTNLVAVKQDQTPVLEGARSDAKVLFLASAEDEFEILDQNSAWVHVRISGLSRGWLRRSNIEILDGSESPVSEAADRKPAEQASAAASSLFSVSSEEVGVFPGSWDALKGKTTRIISVQQAAGSSRITSPQDKLQFAESIFKKEVLSSGVDGLVLIFDAEDGGMVASSREVLDQWQRGKISETNFWKRCYLDPPEILGAPN